MDYLKHSKIEDAYSTLIETQNSKIIAGGTDLLVHYRHKRITPDAIVDIKLIDILSGIKSKDGYCKIGACTTFNEIAEHDLIKNNFDILRQASLYVACHQIRNRATIGGNICNASPAADSVPPLYCLDATLTYFSDGKMNDVKVVDFFKGPGKTVMPENAILCGIKISDDYKGSKGIYLRHSRRNSLDLATVSVAVLNNKGKFSIALGSVAPTVISVTGAEELLNSNGLNEQTLIKASEIASQTATPISDLRASKEYRKEMVKAYTAKALKALMEV